MALKGLDETLLGANGIMVQNGCYAAAGQFPHCHELPEEAVHSGNPPLFFSWPL